MGSPFDYARQVELILVDGMPDPSDTQRYRAAARSKWSSGSRAGPTGIAFVLFTSYEMMQRVAAGLTGWFAERDLALYCQADGVPRSMMIERFKANPRGVLIGTDSFWQGVDVPGEALSERDHHQAAVQRARPAAARGPFGGDPRRRAAIHSSSINCPRRS